ncbi:lipoate--protein ligase family protein [candidate division KSB1 bacterium]|nr:lipoate--protein ligase family protein [candidate division KSB1 bacterium]
MELEIRQDPAESGLRLMEIDRELMEQCSRGAIGPLVRFYEWDCPTLSLGYHQSSDSIDEERRARWQVPCVRRPTGGAAVLHSEELTYAIVVRGDSPGFGGLVQQYVSQAIADGLRALGVDAQVDERGEPMAALPNRTSCFVRTSRWEVTARGRKIVGSAQRKWEGAILQHGSILLGDDHLRIVDLLRVSDERMRAALRERLAAKSTSAEAELGRPINRDDVRLALTESFRVTFRSFCVPQLSGAES